MAVYVDSLIRFGANPRWKFGKSCHLIADSILELKQFAVEIGLKIEWFQFSNSQIPHFDLSSNMRTKAIAKGAIELDRTHFIRKIKDLRKHDFAD